MKHHPISFLSKEEKKYVFISPIKYLYFFVSLYQ